MNARKPRILFVDDEERIVRSLAMAFRTQFDVRATTDPSEAIRLLAAERIDVLVSDQRMPQMMGVELLRRSRETSPGTMRILLTGYSDLADIAGSINEGEVFRFVCKPWDHDELKGTLQRAAEIASATQLEAGTSVAERGDAAPLAVLVVDDAEEAFRAMRDLLGPRYAVVWANTIESAFALLAERQIGLVITDARVAGQDITPALMKLKQVSPGTLTIILSALQDARALIDLINRGQVFRYLPKPIRPNMLRLSADAAAAHLRALAAHPALQARHEVVVSAPEAESPVAQRLSGRIGELLSRIRGRLGAGASAS